MPDLERLFRLHESRLNKRIASQGPGAPEAVELAVREHKEVYETLQDLQSKELDNQNKALNLLLKKIFSGAVFMLNVIWLIAVLRIIWLASAPIDPQKPALRKLYISDTVQVALLGTTTANVLGILVIVVTYVFKDSETDRNNKNG